MKLGAEPKKIAILGALVLAGGYIVYTNVFAGPGVATKKTPAQSPIAANVPAASKSAAAPPNIRRERGPVRGASQQFRPKLVLPAGERPNYATADPTLRLDLLAKVQAVEPEGGSRSLFQFSAAPPPTEAAKSTTQVAAIRP